MKMAEQYKKPQAEKLTIQKHLDGEDIAPYSYLAEDGVITYNGVSFFCDYENNAITLGDMSDEKNVITVQLENGGCLKVNRDNIEDLSKAIAMFSPEDIRRILVALQQDAKSARCSRRSSRTRSSSFWRNVKLIRYLKDNAAICRYLPDS